MGDRGGTTPEENVEVGWRASALTTLAAVIVVVAVLEILSYHDAGAHNTQPPTPAAIMVHTRATAAARAAAGSTAQAQAENATAVAVQTIAAGAVASLQARVTDTAVTAAHAAATAGAHARATAAAQRVAAQARATALAASRWAIRSNGDGSYTLLDTATGVGATAGFPRIAARSRAGVAPAGSTYLWIAASEGNAGRRIAASGPGNFELISSTGAVYLPAAIGPPAGNAVLSMFRPAALPARAQNGGYLGFRIPDSPYTYSLLWREAGSGTHFICHVQVGSAGQVDVTR
ncbi:MAG TPA: hypothetical protein VF221_22520 [Chloroflexota bacterium]